MSEHERLNNFSTSIRAIMELTTKQGAAFLNGALRYIRENLDSEAQAQKILTLLTVHAHPGIRQPDISGKIGNIADSSVSRSLMDLSHLARDRTTGPALVIQHPDPEWRRRNVVDTTPRGEQFIADMVKAGLQAASKVKE